MKASVFVSMTHVRVFRKREAKPDSDAYEGWVELRDTAHSGTVLTQVALAMGLWRYLLSRYWAVRSTTSF